MTSPALLDQTSLLSPIRFTGRITSVRGSAIIADGPLCSVDDICEIKPATEQEGHIATLAHVSSVRDDSITLIPFDDTTRLVPGAKVQLKRTNASAPVGDMLLGRLIDGFGHPIDGSGLALQTHFAQLSGQLLTPLDREDPRQVLQTGIRAIDGLLSIGKGQRLGVFAAAGVGKTTLIQDIARNVDCDVCIACMVGERGREVQDFWTRFSKGENAAERNVCVAATSDTSAPFRIRAVKQAMAMAEYWRDAGKDVVLIIDSITRFAMALREVGLASGAPPTLRAYTPNVFGELPKIVERAGARKCSGSITAVMTILSETDDSDDPIAETMKSLLDGHIVLSRELAEKGQFPAVDILKSISRQSERLVSEDHQRSANKVRRLLAIYEESKVMIESGVYKPGSNAEIDEAIAKRPDVLAFLTQDTSIATDFEESKRLLRTVGGSQ